MIVAKWGEADKLQYILLPIFLGILPLLNAVIDWCSVNITRGLLIKIRKADHGALQSFGYALFDLLLAVCFVFIVTTIVVSVMAGVNSLTQELASKPVLDFALIMADLKDPTKFWHVFWIHGMVLSTLIPTLLHFLFALYAAVLSPRLSWAQRCITRFEAEETGRISLFYYSLFSWIVTAMLAVSIFYVLYLGFGIWLKPLALMLWDWADLLLWWFDSGYRLVKVH